ncbi:MAG: hypothetical protein HRU38_20140 [Saccharospirillaceae bacterium]|nr:hypothetical protein [Pseudomonadales bacterium]NRB80943.1 hypothetical protein [Saccharospirillaceae bacterium]
MAFIKFIIIILVIAAGVGVFSKPDDQVLNDLIYQQTVNDLDNIELNNGDNLLSSALKLACMFTVEQCAQTIVDNLTIEINDYFVLKLAKTNLKEKNSCIGIYKTWKCF